MRLFFSLLACALFLFSAPLAAQAGGKRGDCIGVQCKAFRGGYGAHAHGHPRERCRIVGPTISGKMYIDFRGERRRSLLKGGLPWIKEVKHGQFEAGFNCNRLRNPETVEVYLCVDGTRGGDVPKQYSYVILRSSGKFEEALRTHVLRACLLGPGCPDYQGGPRPPLGQ
jgi:hypothetical protein